MTCNFLFKHSQNFNTSEFPFQIPRVYVRTVKFFVLCSLMLLELTLVKKHVRQDYFLWSFAANNGTLNSCKKLSQ